MNGWLLAHDPFGDLFQVLFLKFATCGVIGGLAAIPIWVWIYRSELRRRDLPKRSIIAISGLLLAGVVVGLLVAPFLPDQIGFGE